jgi:hypothetical protein
MIVSDVFLGILVVVILAVAPTVKGRRTTPVVKSPSVRVLYYCDLMALQVYCVWRICRLVQACLRRLRAQVPNPEVPLATTVTKSEAACCAAPGVQQLLIEDLPRKFSYDEIQAVTGDFGDVVGRGGSAEVFWGVLDDGTVVAVKRMTSYKHRGN